MRRRRFLVLGAQNPFPPRTGAALRLRQHIDALAALGDVRYWGIGTQDDLRDGSSDSDAGVPVEIHGVPPWKRMGLVRRVLRAIPLLIPWHDPYASYLFRRRWARDLAATIRSWRPDVIVVSEAWLFRYLPQVRRAGVPIVFDMHNVESALRNDIAATLQNPIRRVLESYRTRLMARYERTLLRDADQAWTCSESDREHLEALFPDAPPTVVVPNAIDVTSYTPRPARAVPEDPTVGFVGIYNYEPNEAAARRLVDGILPALRRRLPGVRLRLIGKNPTRWMERAAQDDPAIHVTGFVDDIRTELQALHVAAYPLDSGGGTRLKVLEAFAAGIPVVATAKAVEGIDCVPGEHCLQAESDQEFAAAVVRFRQDPGLLERMTASARTLCEEQYSWQAASRRVADAMAALGTD